MPKKRVAAKRKKPSEKSSLKIFFIIFLEIFIILAVFFYASGIFNKKQDNTSKIAQTSSEISPTDNAERYKFNNESKCRFYSIVLKDGSELVIEPNSQVLPDGEEDLGKILHLVNGREEVLFEDFNLYGDTCTPLTLTETDDPNVIILSRSALKLDGSWSQAHFIDLKNNTLLFTWISDDAKGESLKKGDSEVKIGFKFGGVEDKCYDKRGRTSELVDITINTSDAGIIKKPLMINCIYKDEGKYGNKYYLQSELLFELPRYNPNTNSADITLNLVDFALSEDKQRVNRDTQASVNFSIDLNTLEVKKNKN